ncbi:MAG: hypothetical protein Q3960_00870 [Lactobacillus sp.]|nr:hypothetical protein [Lactobacillus sp.]
MKAKAFVLLESMLGLIISIMAVEVISLCIFSGHKLVNDSSKRIDRLYAHHVMKKCHLHQIIVHGKEYDED